jgi:uncharacterized protein (DUF2252 family)
MSFSRFQKIGGGFVILCFFIHGCVSLPTKNASSKATAPAEKWQISEFASKEFFASQATGISPEAFEARWKNSLESPLVFFRSHVRAFYAMTSSLVEPNWPVGFCFGDAHLQNFGFLEGKDGAVRYFFNDFDDSGYCPVRLDALRYFTSLRLSEDAALAEKLIAEYVGILAGQRGLHALSRELFPNFEKVRSKLLRKNVLENSFVRNPRTLNNVSAEVRKSVVQVVEEALAGEGFQEFSVLDVAESVSQGGGSFGLARYWILASVGDVHDVLELKQTVQPATENDKWKSLRENRFEVLKSAFWQTPNAARVYHDTRAMGKTWVVRSRVKDSLEPSEWDAQTREGIYRAQVSQLATLHSKTLPNFSQNDASELSQWLARYSQKTALFFENTHRKF